MRAATVNTNAGAQDKARALTTATLRAGKLLGLTGAQLSGVIGWSESSISRMATGDTLIQPGTKDSELALLLVRCYRSLDALVGSNDEQRRAGVNAYNRALGGVPRELIKQTQGLVKVVEYLDHMRAPN